MVSLVQTQAPTDEPLDIEQIKDFCRITADSAADDGLLEAMQITARQWVENKGVSLMPQKWKLCLDQFPTSLQVLLRVALPFVVSSEIRMPRGPVTSIDSFTYVDQNGATQTLDASKYIWDPNSVPSKLFPPYGQAWPIGRRIPNAVQISYSAGYASVDVIPGCFKLAQLMLINHWNENRELFLENKTINKIPMGIEALLNQEAVFPFDWERY
jgi:uncharacterized phiE125 gp8 family phage protein